MATYITARLSTCGNNVGQLPVCGKIFIYLFKKKAHLIRIKTHLYSKLNENSILLPLQLQMAAISISTEARNSCDKQRVGVQFWKILQKSYD